MWNYRLMKKYCPKTGYESVGIVEAFYDDDDTVMAWTEEFMNICGANPNDAMAVHEMMKEAFTKPMLDEIQLKKELETKKTSLDKSIEEIEKFEDIDKAIEAGVLVPWEKCHSMWAETCPTCGYEFNSDTKQEGIIPIQYYDHTGQNDDKGKEILLSKIHPMKHSYYKCPSCSATWLSYGEIEELRNKLNLELMDKWDN